MTGNTLCEAQGRDQGNLSHEADTGDAHAASRGDGCLGQSEASMRGSWPMRSLVSVMCEEGVETPGVRDAGTSDLTSELRDVATWRSQLSG